MPEIIDFEAKKIEREDHLRGDARCLRCGHEWYAVAPVGTVELECSECRTMKGVFIGVTAPETVWQCDCGNQHFFIDEDGAVCTICGDRQSWE